MNPKISVILPSYNTETYIAQAIESVLQQTETSLEIICVDDASTDSTVDVIKGFQDERIKLYLNENNQGPSYSRNRALKQANGDWIAILDSDDWYEKTRLERLLGLAEEKQLDLVADDLYLIKEKASSPWGTQLSNHGIKAEDLVWIDAVKFVELDLGLKPLIKRRFLVEKNITYDEKLRYGEDYLLLLECLMSSANFALLPEPLYYYRSRPGSLITEKLKTYNQFKETISVLLSKDINLNNIEIKSVLQKRLSKVERTIEYYKVAEPLKNGQIFKAANEMLHNPMVLLLFFSSLTRIFKHRVLNVYRCFSDWRN